MAVEQIQYLSIFRGVKNVCFVSVLISYVPMQKFVSTFISIEQIQRLVAITNQTVRVLINVTIHIYLTAKTCFLLLSVERAFPSLYVYPRFCIVNWTDHHHAAFYPPVTSPSSAYPFIEASITQFVKRVLVEPKWSMVETEHF